MLKENVEYKVKGYTNKWEIVDKFHNYYLLENTTYGDETCYLVVNKNSIVKNLQYRKSNNKIIYLPTIISEVFETYDDIETCLSDEGIL